MTDIHPEIIQSERGSVFSSFSQEELMYMTLNSKREVALCGRVNNPGIIDVPENLKNPV